MKARRLTLGDILELDQDVVRVEPDRIYRSAGILNRGRGLFEKADVLGAETSYSTLYRLRSGQVVYSRLFGWEGAVATVDDSFDGCCVSGEFPTFRLDTDQASLRYIDHYLKSPVFAALIATAGSGLGQRRQRVNVESLLALPIPLPSRPDQDRIAAHLDSLAVIETNAENSRSCAKSLLDSLRERAFGVLSERETAPIGEVLHQIGQLEDVDPKSQYPMLGVRGSGKGAFPSGIMAGADTAYKKLRRFKAGQVCYPKLMAWQGAFTVVPKSLDQHFASPEFVGFEVDERKASVRYIAHCLHWSGFLGEATSRSSGTNANRRRLQPRDFLDIEIPVPRLDTQRQVAARLDLAQRAEETAQRLGVYANSILPATRNEIFNSFL